MKKLNNNGLAFKMWRGQFNKKEKKKDTHFEHKQIEKKKNKEKKKLIRT